MQPDRQQPIKLFISHATADELLAAALVDLCRSALALPPEAIRCTSVPGYRLPGGVDVDDRLRREVHAATAFIGIISHQSIHSPYVLFELGARWGASRHLLPVLAPGIGPDVLTGPLSGIHALESTRDGLHQLVEDLGTELRLATTAATAYQRQIDHVLATPVSAPTAISPGPRAKSSGARRARSASHASTARRTTSGVSSSWASPRPPSPRSPACPVPPSTAS